MLPILSDTAHAALKVLQPLGSRFSREQAAQELVDGIPELSLSDGSLAAVWKELLDSRAVVPSPPGTEQDLIRVYHVATE